MASTSSSSLVLQGIHRAEDALAAAAIALMTVLPVVETLLRPLVGIGIPGSSAYVENLTLWVAYLGAMVASRERRHIDLSGGLRSLPPGLKRAGKVFVAFLSTAVCAGLTWGSFDFVRAELDVPTVIGGWLSASLAEAILPLAFATMTVRMTLQAGGFRDIAMAALGVPAAIAIGFLLAPYASGLLWPGIWAVVLALLLGAPIFVGIGGAALLLFFAEGVPVAAISVETYRVVVSPILPTIPLFTLAGFLLAQSGASTRLVRLFRAWFGWLPGGPAIVVTLACAFFSTFTGASGVTILALGGLLVPTLMAYGYEERLALGLVTSTGSIGQLFPPSLAIILYGVIAHVAIPDLFAAGAIPGLLMVAAVCAYGAFTGSKSAGGRSRFDGREALGALWAAKWEMLVPVVALLGIFGGFCTLTEAAAITAAYVFVVECLIFRDLHLTRELPAILVKSVCLIGGVFVILGVAMGLTNYLVDAEVPARAASWVAANIDSRFVFLLALNLFLLVIGCLDGFSAIIIAVPLVQPIAAEFHIHPLHLAMIFLVNLELGYLAPPLGMNLLLAAYRFDRPLSAMFRATAPFSAVLLAVLLLVTYWPGIIIGVP